MSFQNLKGTRDLMPSEMEARREVFNRIEKVLRSFGFREIDTPSIEPLDLFKVKSGEEIEEQTYSFEDKSGRDITLIPEQTPSRARIVSNDKSLSKPIKWYSKGKRWRYESPQKGRLREFYQVDIDIFGVESVQADAEILAVAAELMKELDLIDVIEILVNDRNLLEELLNEYGIEDTDPVLNIIDDKEKMSEGEFIDSLVSEGLSDDEAGSIEEVTSINGSISGVLDKVEGIVGDKVEDSLNRLRNLEDALESYGIKDKVVFDLSIVRGLDYYTGLVFEVFDKKGDLRAVCGGGRYDSLIELFDGESTSAVGFAPGDAVLEILMKREGVWPDEEIVTDCYVLPVSESVLDESISIAETIREEDNIVELGYKNRNVSNQLDYADKINAEKTIIVGERDLENDEVTVKDMSSGDEEQVSISKINEFFE